jgi:hypothetical protein
MRRSMGIALTLVVLLILGVVPAQAWHGWHGGVSVAIVPHVVVPVYPYWRPYVYPPVVVAPAPVYVQPAPQVYVQPPPPQTTYWYYCDNPQGYYPYVQQCPGGWRPVSPPPPQ